MSLELFTLPNQVNETGLVDRFQRLVQSLLTNTWRFRLQRHEPRGNYTRHFWLAALERPQGLEQREPILWRNFFQQAVRNVTGNTGAGAVQIALVDGGAPTLVGSYDLNRTRQDTQTGATVSLPQTVGGGTHAIELGRLDVRDLEHLPSRVAAAFLAHELTEQTVKRVRGLSSSDADFAIAHEQAMLMESAVMGDTVVGENGVGEADLNGTTRSTRQQEREYQTPGIGASVPEQVGWSWWIPYELPGRIRVVEMRLRGRDVESARVAQFASWQAYEGAARAAGLVRQP
jgi:hypothetical protein